MPTDPAPIVPLAYGLNRAAKALDLSARNLWQLSKEGRIPFVRVGNRLLFPADMLRDWLRQQATAAAPPADTPAKEGGGA